jgi:ribosomal protein S18 acetylase RimI-like enzyme
MEPLIRRLQPADAMVAQQLVADFHGHDLPVDYLRRYLGNAANSLFVAEEDGELAGFIAAHRLDRLNRQESHLFIYDIEVREDFRRRGIGRALLNAVLEMARRDKVEAFVVTNRSNHSAVRFYESTGGIVKNGDDLLFVFRPAKQPR